MRMRKYRKPMPLGCREQIFNVLVMGSSKKLLPFKKKKKPGTYQCGCRGNCAGMCQFLLFLHTMSHFLTRFLKNRSGMLYFPSRLYNRVGIFNTFYRGYIHCGCATSLVSLIQPRLNIFFLLVYRD